MSPPRHFRALSRAVGSGPVLLLAFAFSVMADPVSSVAYAVEAALRALDGNLALLVPTMGLVITIIAIVIVNYQQLIARYPGGGGASAAVGEAFGEGFAFLPIGSLIVDFVLTIAISVSAGASAVIAYFPELAPWRVAIAVGLVALVAVISWFGHLGRVVFALMALSFIVVATVVLLFGIGASPTQPGPLPPVGGHGGGVLAVVLAFPVAMALATGVEAPSSAIAQLGDLGDARRSLFGRVTLWLTLGVVGSITMGLAIEATLLRVGTPGADTTLIADLARHVAPAPVFAAFQLVTALLLLAAASSSFQAGPGLLKALAAHGAGPNSPGVVPPLFGRTNRAFTPYWGVALFAILAVAVVALAGGNDQILVLFYAVAVFLSFLAGLLAMAVFSYRDKRRASFLINVGGSIVVAFTLAINLGRGYPLVSMAAAVVIGSTLYALWARAGRPGGVHDVEGRAEADSEQ